jgi:hypothetical protein
VDADYENCYNAKFKYRNQDVAGSLKGFSPVGRPYVNIIPVLDYLSVECYSEA